MKRIILIVILLFLIIQTNAQIKFKAEEESEIWLGKEWNVEYTSMKNPLNIDFNNNILKLYYDNGSVYSTTTILSCIKKEVRNLDKIEKEVYILKYLDKKGFIGYIIIEKSYFTLGNSFEIKLPFIYSSGEIVQYQLYRKTNIDI